MNTIASKRRIRLCSNLVCILQVIVGRRLFILVRMNHQMNSFFYRRTKKNSYTLRPMESNSSKYSSIQIMHSIQLKFDTYINGYHLTYCVKSDEIKSNIFFTGVQQRILIYYNLWSLIIRNMVVPKWCFRLSSNLICSL